MGNYTYYSDLTGIKFSEENGVTTSWIKMMNHGKYKHPVFGDIVFDPDRTKRFADNVKARVRGIDPDIDYDHKTDATKGNQAAGWIKDAQARPDGLYAFVEWTPTAVAEIKERKWRYVSPEYNDEWTDPAGKQHSDVLLGAGLTNRPFLKDLLPINLSELVFDTPKPTKEKRKKEAQEVDPKELREKLGLPADATDDIVEARMAMIKQLSELGVNPSAPKAEPPKAEPLKAPQITLGEDLKKLAESNPSVKALVAHLEDQIQYSAGVAKQLREADVDRRLSEFDASKIVLTPVARDLVREIMLNEAVDTKLSTQIWELLGQMRTGQALFVELGERTGVSFKYGRGDKSAGEQFKQLSETLVAGGMKYPDAVEKIARDNPKLYEEYRQEATAFHA